MFVNGLCHGTREQLAIHGERRAGRHARDLGCVHHERVEPPHFIFQQADGIVEFVAAERIAADELCETIGLVDFCGPRGPHFVDSDSDASRSGLPGGLAASQPAPDHMEHYAGIGSSTNGASLTNAQSSLLHTSCRPAFLVIFSRRNGAPQSGHASATGRFHSVKSQSG